MAIENARLFDEAHRQQQWLTASSEVTRRLLAGARIDEVLSFVTEQTLQMTAADLVVLALPDADRQHLTISHAAGQNAQAAVGLRLPAQASISGQVLADGQPITVEDFRHDPRTSQAARAALELGPAMLLPLGDADNVRGVLTVGRAAGALPLPRAAGQLAMTFAAQAGIALELAERRQDAERLSIYEDRDRIARDLHDQVIQQLYASGMKLQGTIPLITRPLAEERVNSVVDDLDQTITDIRAVIFSLQARGKGPPSLRSNVLDVVDQMTEAHGMTLRRAAG